MKAGVLINRDRANGTKWPVGQVVKTEASHAFNIGSNPVRVTKITTPMALRYRKPNSLFLTQVSCNKEVGAD